MNEKDDWREIDELLLAGRPIEAIKRWREGTGVGLTEARQAIDARRHVLLQECPERFYDAHHASMRPLLLLLAAVVLIGGAILAAGFLQHLVR
jgi:hypothetical protein